MPLTLKRPLLFFDIEATGLDTSRDRIVELSYIKVSPDGSEEAQTMRFNPTIPISAEATAVNGITDEDVAQCPTFADKAAELARVFSGCDIAGYNSNHFDVPMLVEEFIRAGVEFDVSACNLVDVQGIYHKMEKRTLAAAYQFYCHKDLENAHTAMADTRATLEVLRAQLDHYGDQIPHSIEGLAEFSRFNKNVDLAGRIIYDDKGTPVFNFGKHRGRPVEWVVKNEPGFISWMLQADFPQNTKQALTRLYLKYK
ncbi:exonuclease RNase T and DNA polymerase III [Prevotella sp. CAG:755]|nr:exonuclease RNase T and DNA polymerase III [Prevotella sp. CAG:755]